ncbi:ABC transporter ATP-binding protein [Brenneria tiliae]|uniref:ABC transporter ATP-binding protein n=1 Tax=Brenneria tiliae TaxID=2914984 RepID=UPI002014C20E|nr:ABC transporter ATP-binding protein [Brenneria tiliae]MCL2899110.1 ABC transporter ATP-binding protein [Brenneria tiliae]MCL2903488.1 ABC transporter ATP-binding protein [Brenneria tiliae]
MSAPLLDIRGLDSGYGPVQALRNISLQVNEGEIVALIGANGAGKSTLLMTIFGQPRARGGQIFFAGREITALPSYQVARLGLAQVPEGRRIFPAMTVEENLLMGTVAVGMRHYAQDLKAMFELFPRLQERRYQSAGTMSGGEQQMLAIARALMGRPRMILLDEPSLGLAPLIIADVFRALKRIAAAGSTIFLVEQNANQALSLADRGYVLVNGAICLEGSGRALLNNPDVRKAYLSGH